MTRPIPAKGKFPYPHRTVAEVEREAIEKANRHAILRSLGGR